MFSQENQATLHGSLSKMIVLRTQNAITIHRSGHPIQAPVQVITSTFTSTTDLLVHFDVDCCAVAWEPQRQRVVATPRGLQSLRSRVIVADSSFESKTYIRRLEKYGQQRGFALFVPGLDMSMVRPEIFEGDYTYFEDIDLLVRVSEMEPGPFEFWGGRVKATSMQRATRVRGMERVLVVHRSVYKRTSLSQSPLLSAGVRGRFWIIRGLSQIDISGDSDDSVVDDDGEILYEAVPFCCIQSLMSAAVRGDLFAEGHRVDGGAIFPSQLWRGFNIADMLKSSKVNGRLSFVFDFADCKSPFDSLMYLHDAAREPLRNLSDEAFERQYGLSRRLTFKQRVPRCRSSVNWWEVY